ncbi:hypothetical protein HDU82_001148 [Entophlyctis luteolus]|nr:hypothetical protein HDU82_001148 [Entophlyctis luteolus]
MHTPLYKQRKVVGNNSDAVVSDLERAGVWGMQQQMYNCGVGVEGIEEKLCGDARQRERGVGSAHRPPLHSRPPPLLLLLLLLRALASPACTVPISHTFPLTPLAPLARAFSSASAALAAPRRPRANSSRPRSLPADPADSTDSTDRLLTAAKRRSWLPPQIPTPRINSVPALSAKDVYPQTARETANPPTSAISNDGYALAPLSNSAHPTDLHNAAAPPVDDFDRVVAVAPLNPPDWNSFFTALGAQNTVGAWIALKDILMSDREKSKVKNEHIKPLLELLARNSPHPKINQMKELLQYAQQLNLPHDIDCRNSLLAAYSKIGDYQKARDLAVELPSLGLVPNLRTYNLFLDLQLKDSNLSGVIAFYERMIDEGIEPDVTTFNCILQGCVRLNKENRVESYFQEMQELGISPDQRTLTILCQFYELHVQSDEEAVRLLQKLCADHLKGYSLNQSLAADLVEPNAAVYTALVKAYGSHGALDLAREAFEKGKACEDCDVVLYSVMLHVLVKAAALPSAFTDTKGAPVPEQSSPENDEKLASARKECLDIFAEMMSRSMTVDSIVFAQLVQMFVQSRDPDSAEQVVTVAMRTRGVPVTVSVWSTLVHGYIAVNRLPDAIRVFEQMGTEGVYPPAFVYNAILRALAADFDMESLERYWSRWLWSIDVEANQIKKNTRDWKTNIGGRVSGGGQNGGSTYAKISQPNPESYNIVLDAFVSCGDVEKAAIQLERMKTLKINPSAATFVALIEAHVRRRDYLSAAETMLQMRTAASQLEGSDGLKRIVNRHHKQFESLVVELLDKSEKLHEEAETEKLLPPNRDDGRLFTPGRLARLDIFNIDPVTRAAEIKAKRVLGVELYKEMIAAGCMPTQQTFQCIIRAHTRAGDLVAAVKAWNTLRTFISRPSPAPPASTSTSATTTTTTTTTNTATSDAGAEATAPLPETVAELLNCVRQLGRQTSARAVVDTLRSEGLALDDAGYEHYLFLLARWGWTDELMTAVVDMVNAGRKLTPAAVAAIKSALDMRKDGKTQSQVLGFIEENWPEALVVVDDDDGGGGGGVGEGAADVMRA